MLTDLNIKNFAIIDNLHVAFQPGLTVLTGETGAGKSIIIDAVNLILGGRASGDLIRSGAEEATVEALFDLTDLPEIAERLAELGIESEGELVVKRVVARSGKNRVFIGGSLSTTSALSDIGSRLINIYGQHESQTLLRPENHLLLLDGCAGLDPLRQEFSGLFDCYRQVEAELDSIESGDKEASRRLDLLLFQNDEIAAVNPLPAEDEELEHEHQLLSHGEKLLMTSQGAFDIIYGGDSSILSQLHRIKGGIADIAAIDGTLMPVAESLSSAAIQLEDAALTLRDYAARVEADPARLQTVSDRIDLLNRLKKKYGPALEDVFSMRDAIVQEMEELKGRDSSRSDLEQRMAELKGLMEQKGKKLSAARRDAGKKLKVAMEKELHELAMPHAQFEADFEELAEPRQSGYEKVEFLFSPNPGESVRPLARIASGGELSRLMLALKQVHPESDVPSLVFDEVDSGIGGGTSALVGKKLRKVARSQQVLCITHLPQVAACADHQLLVEKRVEGGRTVTNVTTLDAEGRVAEVARMLGGVKITSRTLEHAKELIDEATC
jgi:DNA repair protein RecN (Recombination protein N)